MIEGNLKSPQYSWSASWNLSFLKTEQESSVGIETIIHYPTIFQKEPEYLYLRMGDKILLEVIEVQVCLCSVSG
jgi:hypothetical protein